MKPLKKNKLTISINRQVQDVFAFVMDPFNTPKWIKSITKAVTKDWPVIEGSVYKYQKADGTWKDYTVTSYLANRSCILKEPDGNYHVRYTFTPTGDSRTEVEYYEWVIRDTLADPFTPEDLQTLKSALEKP